MPPIEPPVGASAGPAAPRPGPGSANPGRPGQPLRMRSASQVQRARVARVPDRDPALLRYLGELGLYPGTPIELVSRAPFGGPIRLRVDGTECIVGEELAGQVRVAVGE